jgi:polyisoprenyl-phosphate glycosyltransferase
MKRISLVVPCRDEQDSLAGLFAAVRDLAGRMPGHALEVVCINDGSRDATLERLLAWQREFPGLVVVDLSRNFGKEAALSAGLAVATGDAVVPLDADLQDPPGLVARMVELWEQGHEVVLARRSDRASDTWLKRTSARLFYRLHNAASDVEIPSDVGDFRLMDRAVVDVINALPENRRFMKGLFAWAGFRTTAIDYARDARADGASRFDTRALWRLAVEGFTSFSLTPLRIASYVGIVAASVSFAYGSWIVFRTLWFGIDLPGYASIFVAVLFLGGLQLIGLGIIGEYVGRTYLEAKGRPAYVIRKVHRRGA